MPDALTTCMFKCDSPDPTDLTPAHVFQESIGGRWAPEVMCRTCNSTAGSTFEKNVKYADTVLLSMEVLWGVIPDAHWKRKFRSGQDYIIVKDDGTKTRAHYRGNAVKVTAGEQPDGSYVLPNDASARGYIEGELRRNGASDEDVAAALAAYNEAEDGDTIHVGTMPGSPTLRKQVEASGEVRIAFTGPITFLDCRTVQFMAFSVLAGLIGDDVMDERFDTIRQLVRLGHGDPAHITIDAIKGPHGFGQIAMYHLRAYTRDDGYSVTLTFNAQQSYEVVFHVEPIGEPWCVVGITDLADTSRPDMEFHTDAPMPAPGSDPFLLPPTIEGFDRGAIRYRT